MNERRERNSVLKVQYYELEIIDNVNVIEEHYNIHNYKCNCNIAGFNQVNIDFVINIWRNTETPRSILLNVQQRQRHT